jgi:hypothetical protein
LQDKSRGPSFCHPLPTQIMPNARPISLPQTPQQTQVSALIDRLAEARGRKLGADRRSFLRTSCGLASTFLAMNKVYGQIFNVEPAEYRRSRNRPAGLRIGDKPEAAWIEE